MSVRLQLPGQLEATPPKVPQVMPYQKPGLPPHLIYGGGNLWIMSGRSVLACQNRRLPYQDTVPYQARLAKQQIVMHPVFSVEVCSLCAAKKNIKKPHH